MNHNKKPVYTRNVFLDKEMLLVYKQGKIVNFSAIDEEKLT